MLRAEDLFATDAYVGDLSADGTASAVWFVATEVAKARLHYEFPYKGRPRAADRFDELARQWQSQTRHLSSATAMAIHPAYQAIIGLGVEAVPLILKELKGRPNHWFWALRALTGIDPVPAEQRGRVSEMAKAWLEWGEEQGLI